jgi:hypothetical protein
MLERIQLHEKLRVLNRLTLFLLTTAALSTLHAATLPYGSEVEVRLLHKVGSRISHPGDRVEVSVITPVFDRDTQVLAAGSTVSGTVERTDRLGLGLRHATARLDLRFTELHLADGTTFPIDARVASVETARESVRGDGAIIGINPTANFSSGVSVLFTLCNLAEREFRLPILGFKFLAARSPDPEIAFPAGTEMVLRVVGNVDLRSPNQPEPVPMLPAAQIADVQNILAALPAQQTNRGPDHPSDLINILIIGGKDQVNRTFNAAGWSMPETHGVLALYHIFHCAVERKSYSGLPMSDLKLNGYSPDASFEKSLDTFAKRHHIRLWRDARSGAWLGAATEDVSYKIYKAHLTHATDRRIDNERAKIVNDLAFTGCIDKGALIPRASLKPVQESGSSIVTDGDIAVLQLNGCETPRMVPTDPQSARPVRAIRAVIAVGVDIARSNPVSVAIGLAKSLGDNSNIKANERLQASRIYIRPSAVASASTTTANGSLAVR